MKHARPGNWLGGRLSKPIDRLWLGGMAAVNVSVWAVFGVKYIGLALIAYCFIFVLALRRQIKAAYPAVADAEYRFGYPCNLPWLTNGDPDKIFLHVLWIFPVYIVVATVLSALFSSVSVLSVPGISCMQWRIPSAASSIVHRLLRRRPTEGRVSDTVAKVIGEKTQRRILISPFDYHNDGIRIGLGRRIDRLCHRTNGRGTFFRNCGIRYKQIICSGT